MAYNQTMTTSNNIPNIKLFQICVGLVGMGKYGDRQFNFSICWLLFFSLAISGSQSLNSSINIDFLCGKFLIFWRNWLPCPAAVWRAISQSSAAGCNGRKVGWWRSSCSGQDGHYPAPCRGQDQGPHWPPGPAPALPPSSSLTPPSYLPPPALLLPAPSQLWSPSLLRPVTGTSRPTTQNRTGWAAGTGSGRWRGDYVIVTLAHEDDVSITSPSRHLVKHCLPKRCPTSKFAGGDGYLVVHSWLSSHSKLVSSTV